IYLPAFGRTLSNDDSLCGHDKLDLHFNGLFRTIFELRQAYRLGVNLSNPKIKKDLLLIDLVIISEIIIGDRLARAVLDLSLIPL
ncbi:hypothetical protein CNR30_01845, partial [Levilactobacillus brevis]|uniref:hypothetical protein n=1 Tax=Levilactobacillus brevis TaxID=1580 RepID=UPI0005A9E6BF